MNPKIVRLSKLPVLQKWNLVMQFAQALIGTFGIGTKEVSRVGGPRYVSHAI
jgi:hypothetical protein